MPHFWKKFRTRDCLATYLNSNPDIHYQYIQTGPDGAFWVMLFDTRWEKGKANLEKVVDNGKIETTAEPKKRRGRPRKKPVD